MSIGLALALSGAQVASLAGKPGTDGTVTYVIQRGDTLDRLSRDYLVPERNWRSLLRLAGISDPRRLPAGRKLVIPRSWLRYTTEPALLASFRGNVSISIEGQAVQPVPGRAVGEGTQLATGGNSFISLRLADESTVVIPSHTRVVVRQLRRILLTGTVDYLIDVERGRLETKVSPVESTNGRYRIQTPVSMTAVRGTEFRVAYDMDRQVAGTEVLSGNVGLAAFVTGAEVKLERGVGAIVDRSGTTRVIDLLSAPELVDPSQLQTGDLVHLRVAAVPGAVRYRAVVAADAGFIENIAEQTTETGAFAFSDLPNGNLFVRVSAIDADGLEGLAQAYSMRRHLASIRGNVDEIVDGYRFRWSGSGGGVRRYRFQLMREAMDAVPVVDEVGLDDEDLTVLNLAPGVYFWRVGLTQVEDGETVQVWTASEKLTIPEAPRGRRR